MRMSNHHLATAIAEKVDNPPNHELRDDPVNRLAMTATFTGCLPPPLVFNLWMVQWAS